MNECGVFSSVPSPEAPPIELAESAATTTPNEPQRATDREIRALADAMIRRYPDAFDLEPTRNPEPRRPE
jgi:hypothetical protein